MEKKIIYQVEEWESDDCSFSNEFKTLKEAREHAKKVLAKPSYGVNAVKIWKCELVSNKDVE